MNEPDVDVYSSKSKNNHPISTTTTHNPVKQISKTITSNHVTKTEEYTIIKESHTDDSMTTKTSIPILSVPTEEIKNKDIYKKKWQ